MGLTQKEAWEASKQGVVVDMKDLTGLKVDVERVDIDVLLTDQPDTFNLMLQAMADMQHDASNVGWFQVAGIHGYPQALWDEVGQSKNTWDNNVKTFGSMGGYCAHGVLTFGTWHRPYLALLEQTLYRRMHDTAEKYTDPSVKSRYLAAAQKFRLPYFDYFRARGRGYEVTAGEIGIDKIRNPAQPAQRSTLAEPDKFAYDFRLPDILMLPRVTIRCQPDDQPKSISNPLYTYRFTSQDGELKSVDKQTLGGFASTEMTIRCPPAKNPASAESHGERQLSYNLNWNVRDRVTMLLAVINDGPYKNWKAVATDNAITPGDMTAVKQTDDHPSGSLEGIHNTYHNLIGYGGHMNDPRFAAFDPVFWFHHCNIDRYYALWQAANPPDPSHPERWFPPKPPATSYDGEKPLLPFYQVRTGPGKGTYWTSDGARETQKLGYVYDDFARITTKGGDVRTYMNDTYIWATRKPNSRDLTDMPIPLLEDKVKASYFFHPPSTSTQTATGQTTKSSRMAATAAPPLDAEPEWTPPAPVSLNAIEPVFDRDWYVDSKVKRMAANGTFTIYFFLSPRGVLPDDDPFLYGSSPYLVGLHHIFTSPREGCDNCADAEAAGKLSVSTTPITSSLLHYLEDVADNGVDSLRPEHIKPFLQEHLRWRVVFEGFDRQDPRNEQLELEVSVSAKVYHNGAEPTYEDYPDVVQVILANASATAGA